MTSLAAIHEGAHAAVSFLCGGSPEEASIRAEGDSLGHVQEVPGTGRAVFRAALSGRDRDFALGQLVSIAAGPVAEAMTKGAMVRSFPFPWDMHGGQKDVPGLKRIIGEVGGLLRVNEDDVVEEAIDLLAEPGIWAAVERVAGSLERWGEIDFDEIRASVNGY